jgi:hypothetical protein
MLVVFTSPVAVGEESMSMSVVGEVLSIVSVVAIVSVVEVEVGDMSVPGVGVGSSLEV